MTTIGNNQFNFSPVSGALTGAFNPPTMGVFQPLTESSFVQLGQGGPFAQVKGNQFAPVGESDLPKLTNGTTKATVLTAGNGYKLGDNLLFYSGGSGKDAFSAVQNVEQLTQLQTQFTKNGEFNRTLDSVNTAKNSGVKAEDVDLASKVAGLRATESATTINEANSEAYIAKTKAEIDIAKQQLALQETKETNDLIKTSIVGGLNLTKQVLDTIRDHRMIGVQENFLDRRADREDRALNIKEQEVQATAEYQQALVAADVKKTKYTEATKVAKAKIAANVEKAKDKNQALSDLFHRRSRNYGYC